MRPIGNDFDRRAAGSTTVNHWIQRRFVPRYPDFKVKVLFADGRAANGNTLLETVRSSYV